MKTVPIALPADLHDDEDFDAGAEAIDRASARV